MPFSTFFPGPADASQSAFLYLFPVPADVSQSAFFYLFPGPADVSQSAFLYLFPGPADVSQSVFLHLLTDRRHAASLLKGKMPVCLNPAVIFLAFIALNQVS